MKRFAMAAVAALAVGSLALTACGNAEKEKQMQTQIDSCTKDKTASDAKATELQAKVDSMQKEMDAMKAAPTPAASPEPTKGGKPGAKATPTAKPAATAAATAAPVESPHGTPMMKATPRLPGLKK